MGRRGAGIFGLYAALVLRRRGEDVVVVEADDGPFLRASLVNQARLHTGYHYPRSVFTALRSAAYSRRFATDFPGAVDGRIRKLYAIARTGSVTDAEAFVRFCESMDIASSTHGRGCVPTHLRIAVNAEQAGEATVAVAWSPKWHARVDGRAVPWGTPARDSSPSGSPRAGARWR